MVPLLMFIFSRIQERRVYRIEAVDINCEQWLIRVVLVDFGENKEKSDA